MLKSSLFRYAFPILLLCHSIVSSAQEKAASDSILQQATLQNVIGYAISHQPLIKQSLLDEEITDAAIKSRLADWYPQINFTYNYQHNFQIQTSVIGGNPIKLGVDNISAAQFTLRQNIFNPDIMLANRSKNDVRTRAKQTTSLNKTELAAIVAKAFYSVLATMQQVKVSEENINRLERSLQDATNQYKAGVADKIDYKRTTIALNNSKADKKGNEAYLNARLEYLKSLMGYPVSADLNIVYDSLQMEREIMLDTSQTLDYNSRIEYQLLQTQRKLQVANKDYNKWSYLPTLYANGAYNMNYQNNKFGKLYSDNYANSFAGISLAFPIFQGFKRVANNKQADLELKRTDWDIINFKSEVNAEYVQALAAYKSNLADYQSLKENVELAKEVYDVVQLQYRSGIKTYLEVITSETDLRTARINYINALYQLLASKIDVEKALGQLKY